jgi:hypothetical protein
MWPSNTKQTFAVEKKNGAYRLAPLRDATNLQFVKNAVPATKD